MSSLRHPNITMFLGLCFFPENRLPLLVMERLDISLDAFLNSTNDCSVALKQSILKDVASGLVYLHNRQPFIIHRDLTSNNVLLNSSLLAKITDMGNSRIIDLRSDWMTQKLTHAPGALVYMPPEALDDQRNYSTPLDIFSFGHLAIYVLTQVLLRNFSLSFHLLLFPFSLPPSPSSLSPSPFLPLPHFCYPFSYLPSTVHYFGSLSYVYLLQAYLLLNLYLRNFPVNFFLVRIPTPRIRRKSEAELNYSVVTLTSNSLTEI